MLLHRTDVRKHVLTLLLHGILSLILALMSAGVLQAQTSVPASGTEKQTRTIIVLPFDFSAGFDTKVSDGLGKIIVQRMTASLVKSGEALGKIGGGASVLLRRSRRLMERPGLGRE